MVLRFADCVIDCDRYEFRRRGQRIDVQPKVWAFLRLLAENAHRVVSKDEILDCLWPDVVVAEGSLQRLASLSRAALGDDALLRTTRGVGYRLAAEVETVDPAQPDEAPNTTEAEPATRATQQIRFCRTVDDVNVAWASTGRGLPIVRVLGWFTNLEYEFAWARARRFWELFGEGRRLIRYDGRGMGLSDPWTDDFSPEVRLRDLEAVADAAGEKQVDLVGLSEGCGTALLFAVRHPEQVRRLVLYGPPAYLFLDTSSQSRNLGRVVLALIEAAWGGGSEIFGHMLAELFVGHAADSETRELFDRMQRASTDRDTAVAYVRTIFADVREVARRIEVPTLVVHRRHDEIASFEAAKAAAAIIPGARFVPLEGDSHWPMADDLAAPVMIRAIRDFLDED